MHGADTHCTAVKVCHVRRAHGSPTPGIASFQRTPRTHVIITEIMDSLNTPIAAYQTPVQMVTGFVPTEKSSNEITFRFQTRVPLDSHGSVFSKYWSYSKAFQRLLPLHRDVDCFTTCQRKKKELLTVCKPIKTRGIL